LYRHCDEQCPKNSFKRLYTLKGLLFFVEKASISQEFRLEFHSGAEVHTHSCFMFIYIHTCNTLFLSRAHANVHMHAHTCIFSHSLSLSFSLSLSISLSHTHTNTHTHTTHTHIHTHPHTHMPFLVFFKKKSRHILCWSLQVCVQLRFYRTWCPLSGITHIYFHIYFLICRKTHIRAHMYVHTHIYVWIHCTYINISYMHAYIHTFIHSYINTYIIYIHTYILTNMHSTNIHTYVHTYLHTNTHTNLQLRSHRMWCPLPKDVALGALRCVSWRIHASCMTWRNYSGMFYLHHHKNIYVWLGILNGYLTYEWANKALSALRCVSWRIFTLHDDVYIRDIPHYYHHR